VEIIFNYYKNVSLSFACSDSEFTSSVRYARVQSVHRYEQANGEIKDVEQSQIPLNFGTAGQA
jgi:hypothetical protein